MIRGTVGRGFRIRGQCGKGVRCEEETEIRVQGGPGTGTPNRDYPEALPSRKKLTERQLGYRLFSSLKHPAQYSAPTRSSISPPPRYGPPTGHASHLKRARPRQPRPPCASLTGHAPLLVHHLHQAHELLQVAIQVYLRECPAVGLLQGLQLLDRDIAAWAFQHVRQDPPQRRFEINSLSVASLAIIFSNSEGCLFTLLIVSFVVQKILSYRMAEANTIL